MTLAMLMAVSPITAQAAGISTYRNGRRFSYAALQLGCQNSLAEKIQLLGTDTDCYKWLEEILKQICQGTPSIPVEPETEAPTTPSEPETPSQPDTENAPVQPESSFAAQVIDLVNIERAREGLKPLTYDAAIEQAALVRAKEIQTSFSHTRPNGSSFSTALKEAGVNYRRAGENIAWGQRTPEEVVNAWMNSPSHRANIMNANYGRIGVGHLTNARGTSYWAQLFAN
ncbi:MAG: hypothetical protein J6J86_00435 [Lachnospiraceae bacterium]|nr:hypothetical protein [Lachnospiraceae bacterium]